MPLRRDPDQIISFEGGINRDNNPKSQPEKTYRYALNAVSFSEKGDIYSLINEKGTTIFSTLPIGYKLIGREEINTDIIVCLVNPSNDNSMIGIINSLDGTFTQKVPVSGENAELGFSINHPIDIKARKIYTGETIIYYTDNNSPMRYTNLDNPPTSDLLGNTKIIPDRQMPIIDFVETLENGGSLHGGIYQFVAQYKTRDLNGIGYGIPCNPIPVANAFRSVGRDKYEGAYPDNPATIAKSIKINITNIDNDFPYLELVAIHYDTISNNFTATALRPLLDITPGTSNIEFVYTGEESSGLPLTKDEVNQVPIVYDTAKCVEMKDDVLVWSNLKQNTERYDFQPIANAIVTKYSIKEVPYVDRLTADAATFFVVKPPFIEVTGGYTFKVQFSQKVDPVTAQTVANYVVNFQPGGATTYTPVSAVVDTTDSTVVIVTMNSGDANQVMDEGTLVTISNIKNFDLSLTIATGSYTVSIDTSTTIPQSIFFEDYKNEELTFNGKSLLREEVYSLGFGVQWKDGSLSPAYPIPGNDKVTSITTTANVTTKVLGTFVSNINYPTGQNYPTGFIRHHKMPSLVQEPHFRVDGTGNTWIRILGVSFENIIIPSNIQDQIQSIYFVRQPRTSSENRSIIAQGVVNNMVRAANGYAYDDGSPDNNSRVYKKNPFFNNFSVSVSTVPAGFVNRDSAAINIDNLQTDRGAFFSPDVVLGSVSLDEVKKIKNVLLLTGYTRVINIILSHNSNKSFTFPLYTRHRYQLKSPLELYLFGNYTNNSTSFSPTETAISFTDSINTQESKTSSNIFSDHDVDNSYGGKYLLFRTTGSFPTSNPYGVSVDLKMNTTNPPTISGATTYENSDTVNVNPNLQNYLYNLTKDNASQYGAIDGTEYVFMAQTTNPTITTFTCYNGDVFITKFAYGNKDNFLYKGLYMTSTDGVYSTNWLEATDDYPSGSGLKGLGFRALGYFFVESTINCNYRHKFLPNGVKYFPYDDELTVLSEDPRNGDSTSYNLQYSFENNVKLFYCKPAVFIETSGYSTRNIYSQKATAGESVDSFRIFPPNNFYDIPRHSGPIWDTFVEGNVLYFHTPKALWRSFMNEVVQQATDTTQLILGTSGLFTIPSREVFTEKGGYGGTISQFGGVHTPFGYVFPDALQGKIFLLANGQLEEISLNGLMRYFNDNLSPLDPGDSSYIDNPFDPASKGIHSVYDYELKRVLITKYHTNANLAFTSSFSMLSKAFVSFHSYISNSYLNMNNKFYSITNSESTVNVYQHNNGPHCNYYGITNNFVVEFVINRASNRGKVFDNIYLNMDVIDENNNIYIHKRPYNVPSGRVDWMYAYNLRKHSGKINLKYSSSILDTKTTSEALVKFVDRLYQIDVPFDAVIDNTQPVCNDFTGDPVLTNINQNALFKGRIKGDYGIIRLSFNNIDDYKIALHSVDCYLRLNSI
jgi:hypothetical protein